MDSDDDSPRPTKRHKADVGTCIICGRKVPTTQLIKPNGQSSWLSLLDAARIRGFEPILKFESDTGEVPDIRYERTCRNNFTHKKSLDRLQKTDHGGPAPTTEHRRAPRGKAHIAESRVYEAKCIFCQKDKYEKVTHSREKLVQCRDLRADETVRNAAKQNITLERSTEERKVDERILALTSRDIVAAEAQYHRTCYRIYTRSRLSEETESNVHTINEESEYWLVESNAYDELFEFIRLDLMKQPRLIMLTDLRDRLECSMRSQGITEIKQSTKKNLRRNLEDAFGSSLLMSSLANRRIVVIPDTLSKETLAKDYVLLKETVEKQTQDLDEQDKQVVSTATYIRNVIKADECQQPWPPHPSELDDNYVTIPHPLRLFLHCLLSGECDTTAGSSRTHRLVSSVAQDIIYKVTSGRVRPAKHVLLPWAVKSTTGNVELVKIMNRLGHGISYTKLEEIDTALCMTKLDTQKDGDGAILPTGTFPSVPTVLAFDNIDRLEETLSGEGTSHRINGIIIQPKVYGPQLPPERRGIGEQRRRSLPPQTEIRPTFFSRQRKCPPAITPREETQLENTAAATARQSNFAWSLLRQANTADQKVCAWTGFNIQTRELPEGTSKDTIGYLPTINAPATEISTVHQILKQVLDIINALEISAVSCIFDQALYARAAKIVWANQDLYQPVVLRMGAFHTVCNLLSVIGKRFGDAGLRDLAVECGIIAEGSIVRVLEGRHYNRGVRLHKIVFEALLRLMWNGFFEWLETNPKLRPVLQEALEQVQGVAEKLDVSSFESLLGQSAVVRILDLFNVYYERMRSENGPLAAFWVSYLDLVETLLGLIRATREGNWPLHLHSIRCLIAWSFAYDKVNYARYLSIYHAQMSRLEETNPDVDQQMVSGGFSVQMSSCNPFGRIPVDQALKETVNKDTQTPGGTRGFSLKPETVAKYYLSAEYRSMAMRQIREFVDGIDTGNRTKHPDLVSSRIRKDERDVQSVVGLLEHEWVQPFSSADDLVSISTGRTVPADVKRDLLDAKEKGQEAYLEFVNKRLAQGVAFFDPLQKLKLKTFASLQAKKKASAADKVTMLKADHHLFGRMLLIAQSRKLEIEQVLQHPLGPIPWALANNDGTLKKTDKAKLARHIDKDISPANDVALPSASIIDGMALVHKMSGDNRTFAEVSEELFQTVLQTYPGSKRIDVVFDVYRDFSIKNAERVKRGSSQGVLFSVIIPTHRIKNWRRLLACSASKENLTHFFAQDWQNKQNKLGGKELFVTYGSKCFRITEDGVTLDVQQLASNQEEADTWLLLHAAHAGKSKFKSVVIVSEDTDVLILCLAFCRRIPCRLYMRVAAKGRNRILSIDKMEEMMGDEVCLALPGLHAYTGCDTVSAFSGVGKIKGFKLMCKEKVFRDTFAALGETWSLTIDMLSALESFTCRLYAARTPETGVNALRFSMWRAKKGGVESGQLPPCKDCLEQHAHRANYQCAVWRRSLEANPDVPAPEPGYGWVVVDDGNLDVLWMSGPPAPQVVLEFMSCKCRRVCELPTCECMVNGLKCTDECRLKDCTNMTDDIEDNLTDGYTSEEESDSGEE